MSGIADAQAEVFEFLSDSSTHGGQAVRRIDTHSATVFLAGARAYKVKRAVQFPFLDYSTLAKRRAACLAELEVNQAFAPQLYRGVVPIARGQHGRLAIDGPGEAVEWAVEMLRFDENRTLDHLAPSGIIDAALADKLATAVVAMHAHAPEVEVGSWLAAVDRFLDQNSAAFRAFPELFPDNDVQHLDQESRTAWERLRPLLMSRGQLGFVRRGHGDLHLGNIALLDGQPVPFDAIEFDPMVAAGDVLYDLAFLLMDMIERGLESPANVVLNGYLTGTHQDEHLDGLAALPFFMSLRAAIRAKVTAARLQHVESGPRAETAQIAKTYFSLGLRLLAPPPPRLIAIGGLSGTGKSSVAQALAPFVHPAPGAVVLRSDVERKSLFEVEPTERLSSDAYRPDVTKQVYDLLAGKARRIIAAGHSVVVDAVYAKPEERAAVAAAAAANGVAFSGLFLVADLSTRLTRIGSRRLDASDATAEFARQQESSSLGHITWQEIDAAGPLPDVVVRARAAVGVAD
jgi:aminoglycoside phosphotransferase family enzyme/predicted kinase